MEVDQQNPRRTWRYWLISPASATLLISLVLLGIALALVGGDARTLVRIGTFFAEGDADVPRSLVSLAA